METGNTTAVSIMSKGDEIRWHKTYYVKLAIVPTGKMETTVAQIKST